MRIGPAGSERPIVRIDETHYLDVSDVVGDFDEAFRIPRGSTKLDREVELGVVISKRTSYLDSVDDAHGAIAGYVVVNDVSFGIEGLGTQRQTVVPAHRPKE
jgi:2-keto-4-pentenoate hydratase/2-oxohepta-3-ene-1,7-dioic acid hydratase in catechol pathway